MVHPVAEQLANLLAREGIEHEQVGPGSFVAVLPGTARRRTTVSLSVGDDALVINAFVCRRPDENAAQVHRWLLQRNAAMFAVAFAIDRHDDIYLAGRVPVDGLTDEDLDRVLGSVLQYADESFNTLLRLGFASAIRREHAWRSARGEPLDNLAAFADLVGDDDRRTDPEGPSAG